MHASSSPISGPRRSEISRLGAFVNELTLLGFRQKSMIITSHCTEYGGRGGSHSWTCKGGGFRESVQGKFSGKSSPTLTHLLTFNDDVVSRASLNPGAFSRDTWLFRGLVWL
ncbi:uncharacterized protein BDCG_17052 [Blastomyces dermatitidis ER-3]|uniref:Uncharacterized protein n=1 Tax=Ajellomyces dermatitidis (strain ER-3 / ATCC MYA-2586) TaxID=559297 RepID=A0ABX2VW45_AJEDR|nr:uncharacterized protein BDCG_17052 [Blastomyces dermatitidis ER-3]OAT01369.1 hypothetical protein BDCG_17052 [Blastomyces dermatitidis ER-3]